MLDEQRRILTAECSEKVLHHELLAAHAEQDRKVLHEELRQQQEFREIHQQDLMRHLELQKFQNSESQKTIMDLSGRTQDFDGSFTEDDDDEDDTLLSLLPTNQKLTLMKTEATSKQQTNKKQQTGFQGCSLT